MSLVRLGKLFRSCLTNYKFSARLFNILIVYINKKRTLKDHKENFSSKFNPSKSELEKVSKQKLEKINKVMVQHLSVNQWKKSTSVIKWFTALENKTASLSNLIYENSILSSQKIKNQLIICCKRIPKYIWRRYSHNKPLPQFITVQR